MYTAELRRLHIKILEFFLDTVKEDAGGTVEGVVEYRGLLLLLGDERVCTVEELDARDEHACQQSKLEHTHQASAKRTEFTDEFVVALAIDGEEGSAL